MTRPGRPSRCAVFALLLVLVAFPASLALAQEAVVTRNVNLRRDPSTGQPPIRLLVPPDTVELVESEQTSGYYHVRTEDREEGWVWGRNLRVLSGGEPSPTSPHTAPAPAPSGDGTAATAVDPNWAKPTPNQTTFTSEGKTCGPSGDGGDTPTNLLKNRTDVPGGVHDVTWDAVASLPYPRPGPQASERLDRGAVGRDPAVRGDRRPGHRVSRRAQASDEWQRGVHELPLDQSQPSGLAHGPRQGGGRRREGCHRGRDDAPGASVAPKWTPIRLPPWVNTDAPVRITGWLMLDPEHSNHLGKYRMTLWEIHPITLIEVFQNGA